MEVNGIKKRLSQSVPGPNPDLGPGTAGRAEEEPHPAGEVKHGSLIQVLRMLLFATWFNCCCVSIHITQWLGVPLYFINRDYWSAWVALTKQSFGLLVITITQWFSPTLVRISGEASMRGQLRRNRDGSLETMLPERLVLIANHQIYTDWLYLWWIAYTSRMHGHIYIMLKESLRYIPFIGPGMMFYGFIFMARKWVSDKARIQYRLQKLSCRHAGPRFGSTDLDPMWLMIFPEGTNLSANTRKGSVKWAEKQHIPDLRHQLLPRSTGLLYCLQQLKGTLDWVYDCTVAYEGTPRDGYAQDYFTLRSTYFQGRPPKSVNMYWRRYHMDDIPLEDSHKFEAWLNARWQEKDRLLEQYKETGLFPADDTTDKVSGLKGAGVIDTEVQLEKWYEIGQIFVIPAALALVADAVSKTLDIVLTLLGR